jgi:hypothetical protein
VTKSKKRKRQREVLQMTNRISSSTKRELKMMMEASNFQIEEDTEEEAEAIMKILAMEAMKVDMVEEATKEAAEVVMKEEAIEAEEAINSSSTNNTSKRDILEN